MKVSIVTISYNQGKFLERAIRSVIEQDYEDIEYIVVDPGSTDGSREIIEKYRDRIDKIIFEPDDGPADGLNKGFNCATGEIFGYINADDEYLPRALRKVVSMFDGNQSVDVLCGAGYIVDQDNNILRKLYSNLFSVRRYVYGGVTIVQQSTFFKRNAFISVGGFNKGNRTCWDGELMLDFGLQRKSFKIVQDFWALFRIHDSSISGSGRLTTQYLIDSERLFKRVYNRNKTWFDTLISVIVRAEKWALNPVALHSRIIDLTSPKRISKKNPWK